jgi:hypothetical protein
MIASPSYQVLESDVTCLLFHHLADLETMVFSILE